MQRYEKGQGVSTLISLLGPILLYKNVRFSTRNLNLQPPLWADAPLADAWHLTPQYLAQLLLLRRPLSQGNPGEFSYYCWLTQYNTGLVAILLI